MWYECPAFRPTKKLPVKVQELALAQLARLGTRKTPTAHTIGILKLTIAVFTAEFSDISTTWWRRTASSS
jgi:hypothetical protein